SNLNSSMNWGAVGSFFCSSLAASHEFCSTSRAISVAAEDGASRAMTPGLLGSSCLNSFARSPEDPLRLGSVRSHVHFCLTPSATPFGASNVYVSQQAGTSYLKDDVGRLTAETLSSALEACTVRIGRENA